MKNFAIADTAHAKTGKNKQDKFNYTILCESIEKHKNGLKYTNEENILFAKYCEENIFMKYVTNKSYDDLFSYLTNDNKLQNADLKLIFLYMTGIRSNAKTREALLKEIKDYIYKIHNFDDMDSKYNKQSLNTTSFDDIEDFYKQFQDSTTDGKGEKPNTKKAIRSDILVLKTPDDIKAFLMKYRSGGTFSKDALIKELSLNEFGYLYKIIYKSPLKSHMRKIDAFNSIELISGTLVKK
jgi:hypothetical protein